MSFTHSFDNANSGNTLTISIAGNHPTTSNANIALTTSSVGSTVQFDFLVAAGGGSGTGAGAGGLRTSWGTHSGGPALRSNLANTNGVANGVQAPSESQIAATPGTRLNIVRGAAGRTIFPQPQPGAFAPNQNQVFNGDASSIIGGNVSIISEGGGIGTINSSNTFTANRITRNGQPGGSGSGGRTYSGNLSTVSSSGGEGSAENGTGNDLPPQGYSGGGGSGRNNSTFGGGGGAGGAGTGRFGTQSNNVSGTPGRGLPVSINGSNTTYSAGSGTTPGSAGRDGIVILRVPTASEGTATGASRTTRGGDTIFTWNGNGTYTV